MSDLVGRRLGDYELLRVVRTRRRSTTYLARFNGRDVDVTVLPTPDEVTVRDAYLADAHRVARLRHPNIVPIEDVGVDDGLVYFVVEHTDVHRTVAEVSTPLPTRAAIGLLVPVLGALQHAHDQDVVHADIAPRRIVLAAPTWPMLIDFVVDAAAPWSKPGAAQPLVLGTPAYLAPEQAFGLRATAAADVYSLAVVGYELLTGRVPFMGDSPEAVLRMQAFAPAPPLRRFRAELPAQLDVALRRALSKDPDQRPSASSLAADLQAAVPDDSGSDVISRALPVEADGHARDYAEGVQAFVAGQWERAVVLLGPLAEHDPGFEDVEALLHAARIALGKGDD